MFKHALWLFRRFSYLFFDLYIFLGGIFLDYLVRFDRWNLIDIFVRWYLNLVFRVLLFALYLCWRQLYFLGANADLRLTLLSNFVCATLKLLYRFFFRNRLSSSRLFYLFCRVTNPLERFCLRLLKLFEWLLHENLLKVGWVLKVIIDCFVEIILYFF